MVVLAVFTALGGLVALLAGAYGLRQTRRITDLGEVTQALVKAVQPGAERPTLQFETGDGRVVEVVSPVPPSRRAPLAAGDRVRIAYDSDDPRETVVLGRERRGIDRGFVAAGAAVLVLGLVLTALAL
ncbi:hypothetical protein GCM10009837_83080 [Streptomyces durmitorensis]|uniref:DUF3592 domain-containing protein n=1 Tax=Streptomyces durmitorensis TaxID=319947 RepID=A0ABY4Q201_9ACTN|nr:DUF3592 domain-containing protein [Streptomyces durmitorensis]UQT59184.1 DUF3592 domain-containing protein [Streptomyces durmitorensis]